MKINMTRKQWAAVILLVIIVPIIYNKTAGFIGGLAPKPAQMMSQAGWGDNTPIDEGNGLA